MGAVFRILVRSRPLRRAAWQPASGIAAVAIHASEVDGAIVHIFDTVVAIETSRASPRGFIRRFTPQCACNGGLRRTLLSFYSPIIRVTITSPVRMRLPASQHR